MASGSITRFVRASLREDGAGPAALETSSHSS